jgi:transcriptional regulator with XRE-family HTH domain
MSLTAAQCRAARALLGWDQIHLAERAGVARSSIQDFEVQKRIPRSGTIDALLNAFQSAGIVFIADADGQGVKLIARRKRRR